MGFRAQCWVSRSQNGSLFAKVAQNYQKTSNISQKATLFLSGGWQNSCYIGNQPLCISSKGPTKDFRTQDCVHGSPSCLFLPKISRCRLIFACSDELKLVSICRHFAPFLTTWGATHLRNHLKLLIKFQSNRSSLCETITHTQLSHPCQGCFSRLSFFSQQLTLLRPFFHSF